MNGNRYPLLMREWVFGLAGASCAIAAFAFACSSEESGGGAASGADASSDGTTNPTGDATTGGDGGPIVPGPSTPLDPAAAARAALFIATCISDDGVNRTLQQLYLERTTNPYRSRAVLDCLAGKTNGCGAVRDCLGIAYSTDGGCGDASCTDNVYNECSGASFRLSVDCAKTGATCVAVPGTYCLAAGESACEDGASGAFVSSCAPPKVESQPLVG